jgi:hypothetical protein
MGRYIKKGNNGGARAGAGRKPLAHKFKGLIAKAETLIAKRMLTLIEQQFKLADGVSVVETSDEIKIVVGMLQQALDPEKYAAIVARLEKVFAVKPDRQAIEYLLNRIMGKPVERTEQDMSISGDIKTLIITRSPDAPEVPSDS